jgi:hypothetical protein
MSAIRLSCLLSALSIVAMATAACGSPGGTKAVTAGTSSDLAWARTCVPRTYGPVTHPFDGMTVATARARAGRHGEAMDFLAADGGCDVGRIPITAGPTYVHAAIAKGRVAFARMSTPHNELHHPRRPLDVRITLDQTSVRTGTPITGHAVVTNNTAHPLVIADCHGEWLQVGLTSRTISSGLGWLDCLTIPGTKLPVGTETIPITIATTYSECTPHVPTATTQTPACTHDAHGRITMPALPPGTYSTETAMLAPKGVPMPRPNTIAVTLTA